MEDLLEDEDEDFDKDDKVIMSRVSESLTHKQHTHAHCRRRDPLIVCKRKNRQMK